LKGIKCLVAASNTSLRLSEVRAYATAVTQAPKAARKKPVTKRSTAAKTSTTREAAKPKTSTRKPAAKKPVVKKKKKPVKKLVKKKPVARRPKKATDSQKIAARVSSLRKLALLDIPKRAPGSGYRIYLAQQLKGTSGQTTRKLADVSREYAALPADARAVRITS